VAQDSRFYPYNIYATQVSVSPKRIKQITLVFSAQAFFNLLYARYKEVRILDYAALSQSLDLESLPWHMINKYWHNKLIYHLLTIYIDDRERFKLSSTNDRCHFITLGVHFCVKHYGRGKARPSGPSTVAIT